MTPLRPIGILDSGVGGLSVAQEIHGQLPGRDLKYIGDSAWCPYGNKSTAQIQERVFALVDRLIGWDCELIVIACNSATIAAVEALRATYPVPFVGMEPGVKPATQMTKTGVIGVLATEASLAGEKFHHLVTRHGTGVRVITQPCPEFVDHVEVGRFDGPEVEASVRKYTGPMIAENADVLVLGCTHYPFLKPAIVRVLGDGVSIIDTGKSVARRVESLLPEKQTEPGKIDIFTTGDPGRTERVLGNVASDFRAACSSVSVFPDV